MLSHVVVPRFFLVDFVALVFSGFSICADFSRIERIQIHFTVISGICSFISGSGGIISVSGNIISGEVTFAGVIRETGRTCFRIGELDITVQVIL